MRDKELVDRLKLRDEKALDFLYKKYHGILFRYIRKKFVKFTDDEIKDLCQETMIVFWEKCTSDFVLTSKISTYLISVIKNNALKLNLLVNKHDNIDNVYDLSEDNNDNIERKESNKILIDAINSLSYDERTILTLCYFEKMTMNEIAQKLNFLNSDVAKSRKYKAFKKLQTYITTKYRRDEFILH